jgi:hypothetical protein
MFHIMVGFDHRLHSSKEEEKAEVDEQVNRHGKRHHIRLIQQHYGVPFNKIVLFDDSPSSLCNEEGWAGVKVNPAVGFCFADLPLALNVSLSSDGATHGS